MQRIILPEIVALGIYDAGLAMRGKAVTPSRKTTMFELELPLGTGGTSYMDAESHPISGDMVICAKPGQLRHTRLPFRCYYIHMVVGEGPLFDMLSRMKNYILPQEMGEIRAIFEELCTHEGIGTPENEVLLASLVLRLIYTLDKYSTPGGVRHAPKSNNRETIEETLAFIEANLTADLDLSRLALRAGYSPIYFHKLFKASTGRTLRAYIEEQRIKRAIRLLLSTDMTLTRIAFECGFSSQAYFSYAFKKRMGISPREYARSVYLEYEK